MKYHLRVGEETAHVDVTKAESGEEAHFSVSGKGYEVHYRALSENHFHVIANEKAAEVFVVRGSGGKHVFIRGRCFLVEDTDKLSSEGKRRYRSEETPGDITPPMPAVVIRILVQEADQVKKGQGLIVLSAMKMETTLAAPYDGKVKKINASIGAKVAPGDILVELEEEVSK